MRMRKKPNLAPRMEKCAAVLVAEPESHLGTWKQDFPGYDELHLELGCGKGRFTAETARREKHAFLAAVERVPDAMVVAMERVCEMGLNNARFMDMDAVRLPQVFAPGEVDRIYVNFCDPWPKSRDAKHRLTAPGFLRLYGQILRDGGEIHFKTDNLPLFDWSVEQMAAEGWALKELTRDLHEFGPVGVMTDYEAKFHAQGVKINRVVAVKTANIRTLADPLPRLRNASLSDARGNQKEDTPCE